MPASALWDGPRGWRRTRQTAFQGTPGARQRRRPESRWQARYMAKLRAGHGVVVKYRRPQGRRLSLAQRWDQALEEQRAVIEAVRAWRETMPPGIADGDRAEAVDGFLDAAVS